MSRQLWWGHRIPAFRFPASLCPPGASLTHPRISVHDGSVWVVAADRAEAEALLAKVCVGVFPCNGCENKAGVLVREPVVLISASWPLADYVFLCGPTVCRLPRRPFPPACCPPSPLPLHRTRMC